MSTALSMWWTVGWIVGAVVVALVAILLLAITGFARGIDKSAQAITGDLDGIAGKTRCLQDVGKTAVAVHVITNGLRRARGAGDMPDPHNRGTALRW